MKKKRSMIVVVGITGMLWIQSVVEARGERIEGNIKAEWVKTVVDLSGPASEELFKAFEEKKTCHDGPPPGVGAPQIQICKITFDWSEPDKLLGIGDLITLSCGAGFNKETGEQLKAVTCRIELDLKKPQMR